jgi:hypothetical protein
MPHHFPIITDQPCKAAGCQSAKPMASPWYYLLHPDGRTTAVKAKNTFDWSGAAKIFSWLN